MNRLCQFLAAPPAGFSPSAQGPALRRLLILIALGAAFASLPLLSPRPAHSAEISGRPAGKAAPAQRQARGKTMTAALSSLPAEPRS